MTKLLAVFAVSAVSFFIFRLGTRRKVDLQAFTALVAFLLAYSLSLFIGPSRYVPATITIDGPMTYSTYTFQMDASSGICVIAAVRATGIQPEVQLLPLTVTLSDELHNAGWFIAGGGEKDKSQRDPTARFDLIPIGDGDIRDVKSRRVLLDSPKEGVTYHMFLLIKHRDSYPVDAVGDLVATLSDNSVDVALADLDYRRD